MAGPYHSTDPYNRNVIDGSDGNDILVGTSKDDAIYGHDGNDYLYGVSGFDTLYGGKGDDVYVTYSDTRIQPLLVENPGEGNDTLLAYGGTYVPDNIENARAMGDYPVSLLGNALDNLLIGNAASNYIDGGAGVDPMIGGAGDDTYTVNTPGDRIVEAADGGYDTVRLFNEFYFNDPSVSTYQMPANVEKAVSVNYGVSIIGNDLDNVISGHGYLDGGVGADTLISYVGRDIFVVDNQNDTVTATDHVDIVLAKADYALSKDADPAYLRI